MLNQLLIFLALTTTGCATDYVNNKALTAEQEVWKTTYLEAQKLQPSQTQSACQKYQELLNKPEPSKGLFDLLNLRINQSCQTKQDPLEQLQTGQSQTEWLKTEAMHIGLSKIGQDYSRIINYLKTDQQMASMEGLRLVYKEKKELVMKAFKWAQSQNDKPAIAELMSLVPTLYVDHGVLVPEILYQRVANDLRFEMRFKEALVYYDKIINVSEKKFLAATTWALKILELEKILKAKMDIRQTYRLDNDRPQSVIVSGQTRKYFHDHYVKYNKNEILKLYHDSTIQYVRDLWTEGDRLKAEKVIEESELFLNGKYTTGQLFWLKGRIEQEKANLELASEYFLLALKQNNDVAFQNNLAWTYAWNEYKLENYETTIEELKKLKDVAKTMEDFALYYKTTYWLASTYERTADSKKAVPLYELAFEENTFGYYGFLSFIRLIQLGIEKLDNFKFDVNTSDILISSDLETGYWLSLLNEHQVAGKYISNQWRTQGSPNAQLDFIESILKLGDFTEQYESAQRVIVDLDNDTRKKLFQKSARWYFSTPYYDFLKKQSEKFGIDYEYVYSIMRQESLFNERARSVADAFGLLQLLPRVAQIEASQINVPYSHPEDLYKPEINIPLGVYYLTKQKSIFKGSDILTAASYNAGENVVKNWLKTRYNGDTLEFIEDIPYTETQNYVKMIFRNYSFYMLTESTHPTAEKLQKITNYFTIFK